MKRKIKWVVIIAAVVCILVLGFQFRFPPDPLIYCQKVLDSAFEQWVLENRAFVFPRAEGTEAELPNVGGKGRDSLALLGPNMPGSYGKGVLRDYGYVPGLRKGDPNDLVMMYLKKQTRRRWNGDHSGSILRKPRWMVIGPDFWDDSGHDEGCYEGGRLEETQVFKIRLLRTLDFLKENNRPCWTNVVREHMEFLSSIGQSGVGAADVEQIRALKEKSKRERREATQVTVPGGQPKSWRFRLVDRDDNTVLDTEGLVIVFEGVPCSGICSGGLQLSGGGASSSSIGTGGRMLRTTYSNGEAGITYAGHRIRFLEEGRLVVVNDHEFRMADDRPTLVIARDGTPTMKNTAPTRISESVGAPSM